MIVFSVSGCECVLPVSGLDWVSRTGAKLVKVHDWSIPKYCWIPGQTVLPSGCILWYILARIGSVVGTFVAIVPTSFYSQETLKSITIYIFCTKLKTKFLKIKIFFFIEIFQLLIVQCWFLKCNYCTF